MTNRSLRKKVTNINNRANRTKFKGTITVEQILNLFKSYKYQCYYCGCNENLTIDHIIPLSKGGSNIIANLVVACKECNNKKGNKIWLV